MQIEIGTTFTMRTGRHWTDAEGNDRRASVTYRGRVTKADANHVEYVVHEILGRADEIPGQPLISCGDPGGIARWAVEDGTMARTADFRLDPMPRTGLAAILLALREADLESNGRAIRTYATGATVCPLEYALGTGPETIGSDTDAVAAGIRGATIDHITFTPAEIALAVIVAADFSDVDEAEDVAGAVYRDTCHRIRRILLRLVARRDAARA